jgi:hypothetical protein
VLEIDPRNERAKAGLAKIADHYEELARESLKKGDTTQTRALIEEGLRAQPGHPGLIALQNEMDHPQPLFGHLTSWLRNLVSR